MAALALDNAKETVNRSTGEMWTSGTLKNLQISVGAAGVSVKGSLAKFHLPDNTFTLTRQGTKETISDLSDALHIDLNAARITRIDVAANMIMQHEPARYYEALGGCRYFDRLATSTDTLSYRSKNKDHRRTLVFYDKLREVEGRGGIIPDVFAGSNLLRYEARWERRLPRQLKEPDITASTLYDSRFYCKVIDLWKDAYFNIEKKKTMKADAIEDIRTVSGLTDYVCAIALQKLPPDEVRNIIDEAKRKGIFEDRNYYYRATRKLKDIAGKAALSETSELVNELDRAVRQAVYDRH
ncbi:hypothetical protein LJC45_02730 [Alistipes sp. OttesenSCG-928-B03]|nr:hypothetical protein [Alistipes sp. OttesenSCG-928-B03]